MSSNCLPLGVIMQPSVRSIAYADVFRRLGLCPREIIMLQGSIPNLDQLKDEARRFAYSEKFFSLERSIDDFVEECGAACIRVSSADANSDEVCHAIERCESRYFIFTGGGILSQRTLGLGKSFIHVHPGLVPRYRGSTCFYYSLLEDFTLASTAFVMAEKLDQGDILAVSRFKVNYRIELDQPLFIDFVLDPFIRAFTLRKVLVKLHAGIELTATRQPPAETPAYFVMHPLLRHLAVKRVNSRFVSSDPAGVFELEGGGENGR